MKWISVKEQKPPEEWVLVSDGQYIAIAMRHKKKWTQNFTFNTLESYRGCISSEIYPREVKWWMRLPKSPNDDEL